MINTRFHHSAVILMNFKCYDMSSNTCIYIAISSILSAPERSLGLCIFMIMSVRLVVTTLSFIYMAKLSVVTRVISLLYDLAHCLNVSFLKSVRIDNNELTHITFGCVHKDFVFVPLAV